MIISQVSYRTNGPLVFILSFEPEFSTNFDYFNIYEQLKFHAEMSNININLGLTSHLEATSLIRALSLVPAPAILLCNLWAKNAGGHFATVTVKRQRMVNA